MLSCFLVTYVGYCNFSEREKTYLFSKNHAPLLTDGMASACLYYYYFFEAILYPSGLAVFLSTNEIAPLPPYGKQAFFSCPGGILFYSEISPVLHDSRKPIWEAFISCSASAEPAKAWQCCSLRINTKQGKTMDTLRRLWRLQPEREILSCNHMVRGSICLRLALWTLGSQQAIIYE